MKYVGETILKKKTRLTGGLKYSQTHRQTHTLTNGKVLSQSCIAAAKKLVGHFLNFL